MNKLRRAAPDWLHQVNRNNNPNRLSRNVTKSHGYHPLVGFLIHSFFHSFFPSSFLFSFFLFLLLLLLFFFVGSLFRFHGSLRSGGLEQKKKHTHTASKATTHESHWLFSSPLIQMVNMCIHAHVHLHPYVRRYIHTRACKYTYIHTRIHLYIYLYI